MTEQHHRCSTCGQEFQGNYCPCCGQSARIGRYSFKNALLLFLDVWGMGNRGMFRTVRDLILRPGYMIRDYISGMQMAYFPPFKLLFLLTALLLIVDSGVNLKGVNYLASNHEQKVSTDNTHTEKGEKKKSAYTFQWERTAQLYLDKVVEFKETNRAFYYVLMMFIYSLPLYLFFHKSPNIPDLRFSELFIAMVYIWGMQNIYEIVLTFFNLYDSDDIIFYVLLLIGIMPLKQLSGYKWWRTTLYVILSYIAVLIIVACLLVAVAQIQLYLEAM